MAAAMPPAAVAPAAQLIVAPPAPPSPPIVTVIPAPTAHRTSGVPAFRAAIDAEVRAGNELLWAGVLHVAPNRAASFSRRQSEAAESCPDDAYVQQQEDQLTVQIGSARLVGTEAGDAFVVSVRWSRPQPGNCPYRGSSRTVELNETVTLGAGATTTVRGDAGLVLHLHRH